MKLSDVLTVLPERTLIQPHPDDPEISGIAHDSRQVKRGDLFVAVIGQETDGHRYIPQAIEKGAAAILGQSREPPCPMAIPYIHTPNSRAALAIVAAAFYGFPSHNLRVIGVTGTDGKTTTTTLIWAILTAAGYHSNMIATTGAVINDNLIDTGVHVTTPDAIEIQRFLAQMVARGAKYAVLETTSHALDQMRVQECAFDVAVITNITHEHLNYHGTFEVYREAKAKLFRGLGESYRKPNIPKVSILNADDSSYEYLARIPADINWTYALSQPADFSARNIRCARHGTTFTATTPGANVAIEMSLLGEHNVSNALAAIAVCYSQGISTVAIQRGIASVARVNARLERVDLGQNFDVFVDYAHTPNAMSKILEFARQVTRKRVIVVFGLSGGLRDTTKRPIMGEIVGKLADKIVITSVDWYTQDVGEIMQQIAVGCEQANRRAEVDFWCIRERQAGITFGIALAQPGDLVIVAGKGHERSISYGGVERPWDEFAAVKNALEIKLKGGNA